MSLVLILSIQQFDKIKNMGKKKKVFVVMSLCSRNQIRKVLSVHGVPPTIVVDNWLRLSKHSGVAERWRDHVPRSLWRSAVDDGPGSSVTDPSLEVGPYLFKWL